MGRISRIASGFLFLALPLSAQAFDLLDAWRAARQYDSAYAAAGADLRAGSEQGIQGRALLLPQINLSGSYNRNAPINQPLASGSGFATGGESHGHAINLTQPLFDVARYAGYRKGQINDALAQTTFETSTQQLMADVAAAYFNVLLAQDTLSATEIAKKAFAGQLAQAKTEFEIGTATITDADEAQAGYDSAVADEIQAQSDLEINLNALARLTGLTPTQLQPLGNNMPIVTPNPATLDGWLALALQNSLKIRAAVQTLALTEQTVTEKRAGHLPVVQLSAGYQDTTTNDPLLTLNAPARTRGNTIGVTVTLPLYAGGGIDSQVREALAKRDSARDQLEDTRRQVRENVRKAWLGVTSGAAYERAQEQRLRSAKSKLASTQLGREVGVRTNLDLLKAQQDYSDVLKNLASARYRYLNARLQLAQAAGLLNEEVLEEVNRSIRH